MLSTLKSRIEKVITVYGIKNCDSIKKARKWLTESGIDYKFHDLRAEGIDAASIDSWIEQAGWETVLNRRGTTWRKLDSKTQESTERDNVTALLLEHPAMIKRPVLDVDGSITVGFKADNYQAIFNK
jgi:arsenate reductase (glutaredoxin)